LGLLAMTEWGVILSASPPVILSGAKNLTELRTGCAKNPRALPDAVAGLDRRLWKEYLHCRYCEWRVDMKTRVQKWGNSLALRIPKSFADEVGIQKETPVEVSLADGKIVVTPVTKPKLTLEQLLSKVTKENLHHEVDTGSAVGNETW